MYKIDSDNILQFLGQSLTPVGYTPTSNPTKRIKATKLTQKFTGTFAGIPVEFILGPEDLGDNFNETNPTKFAAAIKRGALAAVEKLTDLSQEKRELIQTFKDNGAALVDSDHANMFFDSKKKVSSTKTTSKTKNQP